MGCDSIIMFRAEISLFSFLFSEGGEGGGRTLSSSSAESPKEEINPPIFKFQFLCIAYTEPSFYLDGIKELSI